MATVDSVSPPRRVPVPGGKIDYPDMKEITSSSSWPDSDTVADRVHQFEEEPEASTLSPGSEPSGANSEAMLETLLASSSSESSDIGPLPGSTGKVKSNALEASPRDTQVHCASQKNGLKTKEFRPTVPQGPQFHDVHRGDTEKSGRKPSSEGDVSLASSVDHLRKGLRSPEVGSSEKKPFRSTVPKSPNFHRSHRRRMSGSNISTAEADYSLASSSNRLARTLRSPSSPSRQGKSTSPTVPHSPRFHGVNHRELPKSTEQKESEMAEFYRKNGFKARPVMKRRHSTSSFAHHPSKPTKFEEFKLRSEERAASKTRPLSTKSREDVDWEECQKKFHARPAPQFDRQQPVLPSTPSTNPKPFHLSQSNRQRGRSVDSHESKSKFRARRVPTTTYQPKPVEGFCDASSHVSTVGEAPTLNTSSRSSHRRACSEEFARRAESVQREKQQLAEEHRIRKQKEEMHLSRPKPSPPLLNAPFHLESDARHKEYQKRRNEQLAKEEEEARRLTEFRARPILKSPPKKEVVKAAPPTTEVEPFSMPSTTRHDAFEIEHRRKIMEEEAELKEKRVFKLPTKSREILEKAGRIPGFNLDHQSMGADKSNLPVWSWAVFSLLVAFRVANTLLVQSYFDPDEFWQTMEPAYCEAFHGHMGYDCPGFTWEWKRRAPSGTTGFLDQSMQGPARTYLSVVPTYLYFCLLRNMGWDSYWMIARGPMVLYAITVAAPVDMAVWYSARWLKPTQFVSRRDISGWALFCSLSSWFNGYSMVRTLANGQEAQALMLAIALVSPEFIGNVTSRYSFVRSCLAFFIGGLGVCVRFTSVAAFVPMGIILALRLPQTSDRLNYILVPCALFGLAGVSVGMVVDRLMFGFWTVPFMGNFHFNVVLDYASLYGAHPGHWYFTSGIPALAGLLLPFLGMDLVDTQMGKTCYGKRNLWVVIFFYVTTMSFNDHKEFRYILPALPIFCLLAAARVREALWSRTWNARFGVFLFVATNFVALVYLGLFHQSGPISVNRHIVSSVQRLQETTSVETLAISIHYLTGACHSSPLHSSLHLQGATFSTWALDCSPECRADPSKTCETVDFDQDPVSFLGNAYFPCHNSTDGSLTDVNSCAVESDNRVPDFVVTFSKYSDKIRPQLEMLGLRLSARFPHSINGARYGDVTFGTDYYKKEYRHFRIAGRLEVSLDEMVLFSRYAR